MNLSEAKVRLIDNIEAVAAYLLPGGEKKGNYWQAGDIHGSKGSSLRLCLSGSKRGMWIEGNGGEGDDIIGLWSRSRNITGGELYREILDYLGEKAPRMPKDMRVYKKAYVTPKVDFKPIQLLTSEVRNYLIGRNIPASVLDDYRVSEKGRDCAFPYYDELGELRMVKYIGIDREDGKKKVFVSGDSKPILFGMHSQLVKDSQGILVITEGEVDALSYASEGHAAVSLPFGAKKAQVDGSSPNDEWIQNCWDWLQQFHVIYLSTDMDEAGVECRNAIIGRLGQERCKVVELPHKDANECLKNGLKLTPYLEEAKFIEPEDIKNALDLQDASWEKVMQGPRESVGIPLLDWKDRKNGGDFHFKIRPSESTIIVGYNGNGKSNFLYQVISWLAAVKGEKTFIGSYEESADTLLGIMAVQALGRQFGHDEKALYHHVIDQISPHIFFHNKQGNVPYLEFFERAKYCVSRFGVKHTVLDSASCLSDLDLDDNKSVEKFIKVAAEFWKSTKCHLWLVTHPRKGKDELNPPLKSEVKGSGFMTDLVYNVLTVHKEREGLSRIVCSKQRVGGQLPDETFCFDRGSYRLHEEGCFIYPYVTLPSTEEEFTEEVPI